MPRGTLLLVAVGSGGSVADVTARAMRSLAGREASLRDERADSLRSDAVLMQRKMGEKVPEETAITAAVSVTLCGENGIGKTRRVLMLSFLFFVRFLSKTRRNICPFTKKNNCYKNENKKSDFSNFEI